MEYSLCFGTQVGHPCPFRMHASRLVSKKTTKQTATVAILAQVVVGNPRRLEPRWSYLVWIKLQQLYQSCNVTVNVCGVHFTVVSERVPDAPPDTGQMIVQDDSDSGDMDAHAMNDPVAAMPRSHEDGTENGLPMPRLSCQSSAAPSRKSCGDLAVSARSLGVETDRQTVAPDSDVFQFETESEAEGMVITEKTASQTVRKSVSRGL